MSRQRERELERRLLPIHRSASSAAVPANTPPPPADMRLGSGPRHSLGIKQHEVLEGAKRQAAEDSTQTRHNQDGPYISNRRLKSDWDIREEVEHSNLGEIARNNGTSSNDVTESVELGAPSATTPRPALLAKWNPSPAFQTIRVQHILRPAQRSALGLSPE